MGERKVERLILRKEEANVNKEHVSRRNDESKEEQTKVAASDRETKQQKVLLNN